MFPAFLSTILFSISGVCGHRSAKLIGGTEANFWRLTLATVFLGLWSCSFGIALGGIAFPLFFLSGVIGVGVGDVAYFQALPKLGSRLTLLIIECLSVPMSAVIEWLWLGTRLTGQQVFWICVILLGVGIALLPGKHLRLSRGELLTGVLFCIASALAGAYGAVLSRRAYSVAEFSGDCIDGANAAFQRVTGGLLIGGLCLLVVKRAEFRVQSRAQVKLIHEVSKRKWQGVWIWVLLNGLAGQTLGVSCMQWALKTTPSGIVLAIIAVTPIVIIPFSIAMEDEKPTRHSLMGSLLAIVGVCGLTLVH